MSISAKYHEAVKFIEPYILKEKLINLLKQVVRDISEGHAGIVKIADGWSTVDVYTNSHEWVCSIYPTQSHTGLLVHANMPTTTTDEKSKTTGHQLFTGSDSVFEIFTTWKEPFANGQQCYELDSKMFEAFEQKIADCLLYVFSGQRRISNKSPEE